MDSGRASEAGVGGLAELLDGPVLDELRRVATPVQLRAGDLLCSEGEPGDSLYIVESGRLEVFRDAKPSPFTIRFLGAGDVVGELALLCRAPRAASIRAVRDTTLARVSEQAFQRILREEPSFATGLIRVLGDKLRTRPVISTARALRVVSVVALDDAAPTAELAAALTRAFQRRSRASCVGQEDLGRGETAWSAHIDRRERTEQVVVLVAHDADRHGAWSSFCTREADRVVGVAGALPGTSVDRHEDWDLVLCDRAAAPFARRAWTSQMRPRAHHHVVGLATAEVERLARRISGLSVGLVLSGGGARGLAHLGVLDVLDKAGVVIDRIGGTSMGALIAALAASGDPPDVTIQRCRSELSERHPFRDFTIPRTSLIRGRHARTMLERLFGPAHLEDLALDCFSVSADLSTAQLVVHRRGPLVEAIGASMSLPGLAPPVRSGGRLLVDGGVLNNVPVDVMVEAGEGPVIAVDVMRRSPLGRRAERLPSIVETLARATVMGSHQQADARLAAADLVIAPELGSVGLLEFGRFDEIVDAGRRAATDTLSNGVDALRALASP